MLQDEGNKIFSNLLQQAFKKLATYIGKFTKDSSQKAVKKVAGAVENHKKKNIKELIKKHPGIHVAEIESENFKKIEKALQKLKIDFVVEPNLEDKNKYNIIIPSGHKQTIEYLNKKLSNNLQPAPLQDQIKNAKMAADAHNQKIAQQKKQANVLGKAPLKHKSPTH